jgi:ketosteroid isomerase-like protein
MDTGDTAVAPGRFSARGKGGREGTWRFAHVWKLRDGMGARVEPFVDTLAEWSALGNAPLRGVGRRRAER